MAGYKFNDTAGSVLGLLHLGPPPGQRSDWDGRTMSAWALWKAAEASVSRFWSVTRSQVYVELDHLANVGLVDVAPGRGRRGQRFYSLTPEGRAAFRDWLAALANATERDEQLRSTTVLCVFFGEHIAPDRLLAHIRQQRERHQRHGDELSALLAHLADDRRLPTSVARRGAAYHRLMQNWLLDVETSVVARAMKDRPA